LVVGDVEVRGQVVQCFGVDMAGDDDAGFGHADQCVKLNWMM
jgi:hypothetical protein